jgi:hypothetical protein
LPRPLGGLPGDWSPGKPLSADPKKEPRYPYPIPAWTQGFCGARGPQGVSKRTRDKDGIFVVGKVAEELGWRREKVTRAWQSCRRRGLVSVWPGRPLGEGNGNKPHVFRIVLEES